MINREKNKVGSLAVIAILARNCLRPRTLRPILLDSLPFTTLYLLALFSSTLLFPNLEDFRQDCKKLY
ncbi:hypothetical protein ES705_33567 [subsurface metagenome]